MTLTSLQPYLFGFGLILTRCLGLFSMIPTLGGEVIPHRVRGAIAVVIALILLPLGGPQDLAQPLQLIVYGLGELMLGIAMGLVVRLLLTTAEICGEIAGMQMGFAFSRIVDPLTRETAAVTSRLMGIMAILIFLALDGHLLLVTALVRSLKDAPLGTVLPRVAYSTTLFPLLSLIFITAFRMAAPVIIALLVTNGAMALLARAAPQLNLFIFAFGITIGIGMLMFALSSASSFAVLVQEVRRLGEYLGAVSGA